MFYNEDMKTIVVGDIHGCLDELKALVYKVGYRKGVDRFISCGDIVDRGPNSPGCVKYLMEIGAEAVLGNHDSKLLRRWEHTDRANADPSYYSPMRPSSDQEATIHSLTRTEREWLRSLPCMIQLPEYRAAVVHAGMLPGVSIDRQNDRVLTMVRFVDNTTGKMVGMKMPGFEQPENSTMWCDLWDGPCDVIFGHCIFDLDKIYMGQRRPDGPRCFGIDTGCVFGGHLTALVLQEDGDHKVAQVGCMGGVEGYVTLSTSLYG
jgi:hypothetical protein